MGETLRCFPEVLRTDWLLDAAPDKVNFDARTVENMMKG